MSLLTIIATVLGVVLFELIVAGIIYYVFRDKIGDWKLSSGFQNKLGGADALLYIPFDDGVATLKRGNYDKGLVGGMGGYETPDGDKFVVDGRGDVKFNLLGTPIVLCIDPTVHASAVNPIKALIAQRDNLGEWVRVDRDDNVVQHGKALEPASGETQAVTDGGTLSEGETEQLKKATVDKYYDLSPPQRYSEDGDIEQATGFVVSQNEAASLLPKKWTSEQLQTMQDKARLEEHDEGKMVKYLGYGAAGGAVLVGLGVGGMFLMSLLSGGMPLGM